jgi:hypothetical protein
VARDLDDLNGHYEELVDALQRRLQLLCDMAQQELDEFEVMNDFFLFRILFSFSCSSRLSDIMMLLSVDCCWLLLVFPYPLSPSSLDQLVLAATFVC